MKHGKSGFTLVELAIVLVIIGLIVGGVLVGKDLIRQAEIRAVITERDNFATAINTFRIKYNALPGDMRNATNYWPEADVPATCLATLADLDGADQGSHTYTCNGDGDRRIMHIASGSFYEMFLALQHLSFAGLVKGSMNGTAGPDGLLDMEIGENVLTSKISGAAWLIQYAGTLTAADIAGGGGFYDQFFEGQYSHMLGLGRVARHNLPGIGDVMVAPSFSVEEAEVLDLKIDDGKPGRGGLKSWRPIADPASPYANECATTDDPATAEYNNGAGEQCVLLFKLRI